MTTDYAPNGQQAPPRIDDHYPPDVPFGTKHPSQVIPHDWASWILTAMREHELTCLEYEEKFRGKKMSAAEKASAPQPKHFSEWVSDCVKVNL